MNGEDLTEFDGEYLRTWTEPDFAVRRDVIEKLWAAEGRLSVSSAGLVLEGVEAIARHIDMVHEDMIAGKGLAFVYDQHIESGEATLLRWSMLAPDGDAVGRGVDIVFFNGEGKVKSAHMFMGVN